MIRKATQTDIDKIVEIYQKIFDDEEAGRNTTGWIRGIYPSRETAEQALSRGDLFVLEDEDDGEVCAAGIVNQAQVDVYAKAAWKNQVPDEKVMVLHTLVVNPDKKGKGYGKQFIAFYEDFALKNGCPELRIDTNERNSAARKFYAKLNFKEIAVIPTVFNGIPDVNLVCLEKVLQKN